MINITTTRECYDYVLDTLNENDIDFVIIRGFRYLPEKMDTDIDLVINPKCYDKFLEISNKLIQDKLINKNQRKEYVNEITDRKKTIISKYYYHPLITSKELNGKYYRFDTYSDLFFYKNGEGNTNEALVVNSLFKNYLFKDKIKVDNYYIPDPIHEIILLVYRSIFDLKGTWKKKHMRRVNELLHIIDEEKLHFFCDMCFSNSNDMIDSIKNNNYKDINIVEQKLNLFIIRKAALKNDIINNIIKNIEKEGYKIIDKIFVGIGNTQKFYKNFYLNFTNYEKEILEINNNQCLVIVTDRPIKLNPNKLKSKIRKMYAEVFPDTPGGIKGNIIHASDSHFDADKELSLLFKENILNFKKIGTHYNYHD